MIAYNADSSQTYKHNITKKVNAANWINLKISRLSGVYEIKVDYKLVYNKTNSLPTTWTNVNLVTGHTKGKENISTIVHYRDFKVNTVDNICKTKGKNNK